MPIIRCNSIKCLHNVKRFCGVSESTIIDISNDGKCIDESIVTDEEYKCITGTNRCLTDVEGDKHELAP